MAEYIDRETVDKELRDFIHELNRTHADAESNAVFEALARIRRLPAADAIEELSYDVDITNAANTALYGALPKWIPVTKRLPEIGEYVLVYLFNRSPYIAWIDRTGQWQTEEFWLDAEDAPKAWMPLPEPYETPKEDIS